ncbi:hypothetical protein Q7C36_019725 [Tachysurus vachellii]|uniref:Uncharacterized protein n=1 Tax=Tachysurus vachellii TaxID=175792 RepID=A0AA88RWQ5_TACVA|nr:hypothetical protein Q7C36_019725 [Tachysurus vachellii]
MSLAGCHALVTWRRLERKPRGIDYLSSVQVSSRDDAESYRVPSLIRTDPLKLFLLLIKETPYYCLES